MGVQREKKNRDWGEGTHYIMIIHAVMENKAW